MSEDKQIIKIENPTSSQIKEAIDKKVHFEIVANNKERKQDDYINVAEKYIESLGYKCRVKLANREAILPTLILPNPANVAMAAVQVVHNLWTYNPDWTILKHKFNRGITVVYNKEEKVEEEPNW
ncbi:hypothetical protein ABLB03_23510 [Vibrio parahaemolyticus]